MIGSMGHGLPGETSETGGRARRGQRLEVRGQRQRTEKGAFGLISSYNV
jgi:hypothetical protein